ncbi:MAG: PIN domain-containing protein [Candidatus Aminicenantes bacterium]|jgi:predicted nucleic acid-binding protein|nr:PIN domain-containing protein [Candidatus Aminicenantes bacterium]
MSYLFDTTVLIGYFHRQKESETYIAKIMDGILQASISSVTIAEVYSGIRRDDISRIDQTEAILSFFQIEDVTDEIAKEGGKLFNAYRHQMGQKCIDDKGPLLDAMIAATAKIRKMILTTNNYCHFKPMEDDGHIKCEKIP